MLSCKLRLRHFERSGLQLLDLLSARNKRKFRYLVHDTSRPLARIITALPALAIVEMNPPMSSA